MRLLGPVPSGLETSIAPLVTSINPALLALHGVGIEVAGQLLVTAGDNPHRFRSEAAFAMLCGAAPIQTETARVSKLPPKRGRPTRDLAVDHEPLVRLVTKPDYALPGPTRFQLCRDDPTTRAHPTPPGPRRAPHPDLGGHAARASFRDHHACVRRLTLINGRLEALRRNARCVRNLIDYRIRLSLRCGNLALRFLKFPYGLLSGEGGAVGAEMRSGVGLGEGVGVDEAVDTTRYPLDDPGCPAWTEVVEYARAGLRAQGVTVLRDVVRPELRDRLRAEGDAVAPEANTATARVNVYNTDPDPDLPAWHPARVALTRRNAFVARDRIPTGHLVQALYEHAGFRALLAECFEFEEVHPLADPYSGVTFNVVAPGDEHPWHFDTNEIAVSLLTRKPEVGGTFEYCPAIRAPADENLAGVRAVLDGDRAAVRSLVLRPGDLQLFRGRFSLHRVTPVAGASARHTAIFAYSDRSGVVGSPTRTRQLFGRVDARHLAAAAVRSDALMD